MIIKTRDEPLELRVLRSLNVRMQLPEKDQQNYFYAERGYEGEKKLDELLIDVSKDCLILNNLLLECKNALFQIDSLIIHSEKIFLLDSKYNEGVHYIQEHRWYRQNGIEIKDPLLQLNRCEALFRQWLQQFQLSFLIDSRLIFVHSEFTLFEAPRQFPIILPTQINSFLKSINKSSSKLTKKHLRLSELLLAHHKEENPYSRLPEYKYELLQKGIVCSKCRSFLTEYNLVNFICSSCGKLEKIDDCIIRSVEEYKMLFPERKVTVPAIKEWCLVVESNKTIRRVLQKNYKRIGERNSSHYVE